MKIISPPAIALCRQNAAGVCEHCRRGGFLNCGEVHHVFAKGIGGARRIDRDINLIFICPICHRAVHDGNIPRAALLAIVARREGRTEESIQEEVWELQRLPKEAS